MSDASLPDRLRGWARSQPDKAATIFYGAELTFGELDDLSDRFAGFLIEHGVVPGARVAVMLPNCPQFVIAFYGTIKAGAVHVPVNPLFRAEELRHELLDAEPDVLVAWDKLIPLVTETEAAPRVLAAASPADYLPQVCTIPVHPILGETAAGIGPAIPWSQIMAGPRPRILPTAGIDALAALNYTGGTTGLPKGCEHTQRHMIYTAESVARAWPLAIGSDAPTTLVFLPVFWIAGEVLGVILPVVTGGTCVLLTRWSPEAVLTAIDRYRVEVLSGTVDNYVALMDHPDIDMYDLSSVRLPIAASFVEKLNLEHRRRWQTIAGEHSVLREAAFGMTETHTFDTTLTGFQDDDRDLRSRPVFCGAPVAGTEFRIVDFDSGLPVAVGKEGEICVRSPSLFTGYWRDPAATRAVLRDGWLHTGDLGALDQEGCLYFLGRRKEMLKVNGMSVFPSEVEVLIGRHPNVLACAVIGVPDQECGERPVAFVTSNRPVTEKELTGWCATNMATYKVPVIRIVDELPMTATGKVRKNILAGWYHQ